MQVRSKLIIAAAATALARAAAAQTATTGVGRAASAAVTPGDQNMGRNPESRSGGVMGNERNQTGSGTTSGPRSEAESFSSASERRVTTRPI